MLSLLPDLQGKKLLDLGCGTGGHLQLYLERNAERVVGTDLSVKMLEQAEKDLQKCGQFSGRFSLYQLPMEKLTELPESDFDVITSSFAFHYIEDFPALLAMIGNKLSLMAYSFFPKSIRLQLAIKKGNAGKKMRKNSKSLIV